MADSLGPYTRITASVEDGVGHITLAAPDEYNRMPHPEQTPVFEYDRVGGLPKGAVYNVAKSRRSR